MKTITKYAVLILCSALLFGCSANNAPESDASPSDTPISATQTLAQSTPALAPTATSTPEPLTTPVPNENGLTIEENEIIGDVSLDPLIFTPVHGSQDAILARHADEKEDTQRASSSVTMDDGQKLQAITDTTSDENIKVVLSLDGESIFDVDAGEAGSIDAFQGLVVEDGGWVLEIAYVTTTREDNATYSESVGRVYRAGVNLNEQYGYDEIFGYQLLDGKPFYFYRLDGVIHVFYDGEDLPIWYDEVEHHRCCSAGALNPTQAGNWVGFWGMRDGVWYYTEVGRY